MDILKCALSGNFTDCNGFTECGSCGNHICKSKALKLNGICPFCYGRLYDIN